MGGLAAFCLSDGRRGGQDPASRASIRPRREPLPAFALLLSVSEGFYDFS